MVGLCGEFPSGQLNRLIESDSYAEKVVTDLKQSKLIRTHYKDGLRGYRLTKRASLGVNVGNTGGNMMAELLIAGRGLASSFRGHGGGSHSSSHSSSPGSAAVQSSFLSGGLAGAVGRQTERSAVNAATGYTEGPSIGNALYQSSLEKGGDFANNVISNIAQGNYGQVGSIKGDGAVSAFQSYMGIQNEDKTDHSYFLKQGLANNEDFYYMNLLITITAGDLEELQWRIQEMKKLLISQDMDLRSCYFLQEQGFLSSLPLVNLDKKLYELSKRNVLTTGAASCYPFVSYSICDDNGILFGVNKHNNSLVIADIFDSKQYKNSNIAILGTSGSGKTFTMQTMALRMRRKGIQVFIIAPLKGHEFYRAARNVGGTFIQISPASQNCINVMEIRKVDNSVNELLDGPTLDASALASKIQRLHVFFSLLIPDMSHEEKQLLDEALIKTYARKGITHKNESLIDPKHPEHYKAMPILGDVYDVLMETEDTKRLAHILNRLVHGSASSFNQQTNVDLTNKYTVLDISELTGSSDLLTVGMFVALDYVWDKAKENRTEEKAIFVDEVWQLIGASSNRLAAEFVLEIAKIIRAYSGAGIFATQDLNDFFALDDGKYGKGIINNCKTKIILNMEDEEAQRVKTILRLSETEVMNITHFQRGNGLISTNNNNITVEFKASNLEKELITTDRQELLEILKRQDKKVG